MSDATTHGPAPATEPHATTSARPAPTERRRGNWLVLGVGLLALLALVVLATLVTPDDRGYGTHEQLGLPPCMTMKVAGVPCPGCGVTTSVTLFVHGRFVDALHTQPFGVLCAIAIPLFLLWALWMHARGRDLVALMTGQNAKRWILPSLIAMVVAWGYKLIVTFS